jgi:hypothetical protein
MTRNDERLGLLEGRGRVLLRVGRFAWVYEAPSFETHRRPSRRRTWLSRTRVKVLLWVRRRRKRPVHWEQLHHERKNGTRVFPGGGMPHDAYASAFMLAESLRKEQRNRREGD